jgi:hypothetical protein
MDQFIESQVLIPGRWRPLDPMDGDNTVRARVLRAMQSQIQECKETV